MLAANHNRFYIAFVVAFLLAIATLVSGSNLRGKDDTPNANKIRQLSSENSWKLSDLRSGATPYAIGHRGFGATDDSGVLDGLPTENTVESVLTAFDMGARVVEVDVVLTADGDAFVDHDDYLEDFTCINQMTTEELKEVLPESTTLFKLLQRVESYTRRNDIDAKPSGLVLIEVKTPSPLCDPEDETEEALMTAVISDIRKANMEAHVEISSFSPALLMIAKDLAPAIPRSLPMSAIQFLTDPAQVFALTGLEVTPIDKENNVGLQWAETGPLYRLPGYTFTQYVATATTAGATSVSLDKLYLGLAEELAAGSATAIVAGLHAQGFVVHGWTVQSTEDWSFLEMIGVDGIFTDLVEEGIAMQT